MMSGRRKQAPPVNYERGQQDLVAAAAKHCPTCGGPWTGAVRVCRACGQVISPRHRWREIAVGPATFTREHIDCANPTAGPPRRAAKGDQAAAGGPTDSNPSETP